MAQDKQNTLRILQSKNKKTQKKSSAYVLLGFFGGVVSTCLLFFIYTTSNPFESRTNTAEQQASNFPENKHPEDNISKQNSQQSDITDIEKEQNTTLVSEKELSGLFTPQNNNLSKPIPITKTPFENISEAKAKKSEEKKRTQRDATATQDKIDNKEKQAKKEDNKSAVKEQIKEILNIEGKTEASTKEKID